MRLSRDEIESFLNVILSELSKEGMQRVADKKQEMLNKIEADLTYVKASIKVDLDFKVGVRCFKSQKFFYSTQDLTQYDVIEELGITSINTGLLESYIITEALSFNFDLRTTEEFIQLIKNKYVSSNTKTN